MKNWKGYFEDKILFRGEDYFESNAVRIMESSPTHIDAQVAGSRIYNVRINMNEVNITSMYCDCPYFQGYDYCKHLAATLYYLDEHPELTEKKDYTELLSSLSKDELVRFLADEISDNPYLAIKLELFKNNSADEEYFINRLNGCLDDSFEVLKFLDSDVQNLIAKGQFELMFKLLTIIIDNINGNLAYWNFSSVEDVVNKIDSVVSQVRNDADIDDISDFLEHAISTTDNLVIEDILMDCMSRNGDMDRLFDE
ncbi:SWIM zinc finger domain-containing protein [Methanobrevibacter sp.]|uniref:SWIM zinc finger family protein n=1 Tax=Methanobrevibacter sp. TaxID=66852 RepID=UPI0026DF6022|nr:SWIM zinc finger family protein [Methanobrevibacter sp.]MDO5859877.1 SWIM zinc finger family protein [Methanobrevibacter sp.]